MEKASSTPGGRVQGRLQAEGRDEGGIMDGPSHIGRPGDGKRNTNQGVLRTRDNPDAVGRNLIVTSTASEVFALKLHEVTKVQLGTVTYELLPYLKPIPGTVRGVVHGIEAETSERELQMELLSAKGHNIMHARMLGKSNSALLTFQGPHVPFYVKVGSAYTRCRPHRRSVQYCRACGEVGHRQDVCPHPDTNQCPRCGEKVNPEGHECQPRCKICDQPYETASKECKRRLKPRPPPLHVREKNDSGNQQVTWNADTRQKAQ
ncbi:unnamed protein product, partial [Ixodes pacificus]